MHDWRLLRKYVEEDSQAAFADLVRRYTDLVYCTCLREIGDAPLAEEATQAVFLVLARKAPSFGHGTTLSSWLFQTALLTSKNVFRQEQRRRRLEERAATHMEQTTRRGLDGWEQAEPLLNDALRSLSAVQRGLVLQRFWEDRPLAEIGQSLGISEDAARMRINRALERLRRWFAARNVILSAAALAAGLPLAVRPAPARCAEAVLRACLLPAGLPKPDSPVHAIAQGVIHTMNLKRLRLQLGAAALVAALSLGTAGAIRVTTQAKARTVAEKQQDQAHALAVLDRMYATYAAMHSFKCDVLNQETNNGGQVASYEIERPNKIRFRRATLINDVELSGKALAVSDGSNLYVTCTENKGLADRYAKIPLYHSDGPFSDFGGLPSWGSAGITGMPDVLLGDKLGPITNLSPPEYSLGPPTTMDFSGIRHPVALDVVVARMTYRVGTPGRDWKGAAEIVAYYIGQSDHLLYQVTVADPLGPTTWDVDKETINGMEINPKPEPSDFVFTPPPGSHEVGRVSDLFPGGRM
jgi:RNA polymerase sigma factor (sigma-70 family)